MRSFYYLVSMACLVSILLCRLANLVSTPGGGVRFALSRHSTRLSTYPHLRSRLKMHSCDGAVLKLNARHGCSIPRVPALSVTECATFTARGSVACCSCDSAVRNVRGQSHSVVAATVCTAKLTNKILQFAYKICVCVCVCSLDLRTNS